MPPVPAPLTAEKAEGVAITGHDMDGRVMSKKDDYTHALNGNGAQFPERKGNGLVNSMQLNGLQACDASLDRVQSLYNARRFEECRKVSIAHHQTNPRSSVNLLLLGGACFHLGDFESSLYYNKLVLEMEPGNRHALCNAGNSCMELGDVSNSLGYYEHAIGSEPSLETSFVLNIARNYLQRGAADAATVLLRHYLELYPQDSACHFQLGTILFMNDRQAEAKAHLNEALAHDARNAMAWSLLGAIYNTEKNHTQAIHAYKCAVAIDPKFADAFNNLGNVYKELRMLSDAIAMYKSAIAIKRHFPICHSNLAAAYYDMGMVDEAIEAYKRAIHYDPMHADAHNNLGNVYKGKGMSTQAIECYRKALGVAPQHFHALNNLGNTLKDVGNVADALHCYERAIVCAPKFAPLYNNYASLLKDIGRIQEAQWYYQESIRIDPTFADPQSNLGNLYKETGRIEEAMVCYKKAIELNPNLADPYGNLAATQKDCGDLVGAIENYKKALHLRPNFPDAFANLVHSLQFICAWDGLGKMFRDLFQQQQEHIMNKVLPPVQPFHAMVYPMEPSMQLEISKMYAERARANMALVQPVLQQEFEASPITRIQYSSGKKERLRIGYVSSDFGNHPLSHLMQSVFGMHDKTLFEVFCFALSPSDNSQWRITIMSQVEHFIEIHTLSNEDAARLIRKNRIHILINLNGYTKGARTEIFAMNPAPVQVSYMGFAGSMGADYIHYLVTDDIVSPPEKEAHYTEKLVWMPDSYFVNDYIQSYQEAVSGVVPCTRTQYGLPENKFIFANFNQLYKIDPDIFDVWCRILQAVPNSVLWLLRFPAVGEENIRREAEKRGLAQDKLVFTDVAQKAEHIRRSALADLFLDTPQCNAHTTGTDVLWAGLPLLTCPREKMSSRVAASLVTAAGVPELVVSSFKEYEVRAIQLAKNPGGELAIIRSKIVSTRMQSRLFDTKRWVQNLEAGYAKMWWIHESGNSPQHIRLAGEAELIRRRLVEETAPAVVLLPNDMSMPPPGTMGVMQLQGDQHQQMMMMASNSGAALNVPPVQVAQEVMPLMMPAGHTAVISPPPVMAWQNIPSAGMGGWHHATLWHQAPCAPQWQTPHGWIQGVSDADAGVGTATGPVYHIPILADHGSYPETGIIPAQDNPYGFQTTGGLMTHDQQVAVQQHQLMRQVHQDGPYQYAASSQLQQLQQEQQAAAHQAAAHQMVAQQAAAQQVAAQQAVAQQVAHHQAVAQAEHQMAVHQQAVAHQAAVQQAAAHQQAVAQQAQMIQAQVQAHVDSSGQLPAPHQPPQQMSGGLPVFYNVSGGIQPHQYGGGY